ncbi:hypothetical protein HHI36_006466, partial [Cryptolaemus montrouzieri]
KQSDDESSEEEDFKLPRNTGKRMRKFEKTLNIETRNHGRGHRRGPPLDGRGRQTS